MALIKNICKLLLLAFVLNACNNNTPQENKVIITPKQADIIAPLIDSVKTTSVNISNQPSQLLIDITNYLDSIGFTYDTVRIKKLPYFDRRNYFKFQLKALYKLTPQKTSVYTTLPFIQQNCNVDTATINFSVFKPVKNIYGYFYREKKSTDEYIRDGVVEEWQFPSIKEAEQAAVEINRIKHCVYFNTASYLCRYNNSLYIFHTRASAFCGILTKTVKRFKTRFDVIYPTFDWDGAIINE